MAADSAGPALSRLALTDAELAARLKVLREHGASGLDWEEPGPGGSKLAYRVTLYQRTEADPAADEKQPPAVVDEKPLPTAAELALDPTRAREFGQAPAGDEE